MLRRGHFLFPYIILLFTNYKNCLFSTYLLYDFVLIFPFFGTSGNLFSLADVDGGGKVGKLNVARMADVFMPEVMPSAR